MSGTRAALIWAHIGQQSRAAPVSLAHVCAATVAGVPVDAVALTLRVSSTGTEVVHATNQVAGELEARQLGLGQGPGVDALTGAGLVVIADVDTPDVMARWPSFAPAAMDLGVRAVFAVPLQVGAIRLGVLDLYRSSPGPLSRLQLADALAFADAASMLLLDESAGMRPDAVDLAWHDEDRGAHRAEVHQATGMVLAQVGSTADSAFALLRAYGYAHDRRLGDVAREVVQRRLRFAPDVPGTSESTGPVRGVNG